VPWIHPLMCYNLTVAVNRQWYSTNTIRKNPKTKCCVCVSAGVVDCGPCVDLLCKLPWDKTLRFIEQQRVSYTPMHPKVKRMAALVSKTQSKRLRCVCVFVNTYVYTHICTHIHKLMYGMCITMRVILIYFHSFLVFDCNYAYTTHLHLASRLRMSRSIPQFPPYVFEVWTGKTFYLACVIPNFNLHCEWTFKCIDIW
jgi:hypothetical protein